MKENIVYKGSERRVIVVKSNHGKHFEEAHFYLRAGEAASMPDLLCEANRIVEQALLPPRVKKTREKRRWFVCGWGTGIVTAGLITAVFQLLEILLD